MWFGLGSTLILPPFLKLLLAMEGKTYGYIMVLMGTKMGYKKSSLHCKGNFSGIWIGALVGPLC